MRVLVIDDESGIRELLVEKLTQVGVRSFEEASSVDEAKSILDTDDNFDLIISDYKMHDGHGGDLLRYLYEQDFDTPFVFFTSTMELDLPSTSENFLGVIDKSDFKELVKLVEEKNRMKQTQKR